MKSKLFTFNLQDVLKGLFVAFITSLLTGVWQLFQTGSALNWPTIQPVLFTAIAAGLSYIIKNVLSNSEGEILKGEKSAEGKRVLRERKTILKYGGVVKILILACLMSFMGLTASAQSIFKPVPSNLFSADKGIKATGQTTFLPRFALSASGTEIFMSEGQLKQVSFARIGVGVSIAHFVPGESEPVNDYSITPLLFFPSGEMGVTPAVIVSALKFIGLSPGVGLGYDFGLKKPKVFINAILNF